MNRKLLAGLVLVLASTTNAYANQSFYCNDNAGDEFIVNNSDGRLLVFYNGRPKKAPGNGAIFGSRTESSKDITLRYFIKDDPKVYDIVASSKNNDIVYKVLTANGATRYKCYFR